jgi:hypothetical protein
MIHAPGMAAGQYIHNNNNNNNNKAKARPAL